MSLLSPLRPPPCSPILLLTRPLSLSLSPPSMMNNAPYATFAHRRLKLLQEKFSLYQMLNAEKEFLSIKALSHRDFYNVRKVDNHIHHSACMNQKHLLRFIKKRVREEGNLPVIERDGKVLSLKQVFESLGLSPYDLNIDVLDMHAHNTKNTTFYRFDRFNQKFNPTGEARLREIFLKTSNYVKGKFLAGITKEVFEDLAASKYQMAEYRLSIYGKSKSEWSQLASWWYDNKLVSPNVVWMVQVSLSPKRAAASAREFKSTHSHRVFFSLFSAREMNRFPGSTLFTGRPECSRILLSSFQIFLSRSLRSRGSPTRTQSWWLFLTTWLDSTLSMMRASTRGRSTERYDCTRPPPPSH